MPGKDVGRFYPYFEKVEQSIVEESKEPSPPNPRLPAEESKEDQNSVHMPPKASSEQRPHGIIICVDDNFVNLNSIRLMLEMMGY